MQDIQVFNNKIAKHECNIQNLITEMNIAKENIILQIELFIKEWYNSEIEGNVKSKAEHTKNIGIDQLKELKNDLKLLVDNTPNLIEKHITKNKIWIHEGIETSLLNMNYSQTINLNYKVKNDFYDIIKELFGYCGEILLKYKYIELSTNSEWKKDYNTNRIKYVYGYNKPKNLEEPINIYLSMLDNLCNEVYELTQTKSNKAKAEASNLWDQA